MKKTLLILVSGLMLIAFTGCKEQIQTPPITQKSMEIKLSTTAFKEGEKIPDKYSCKGEDISPYLKWEGTPENTKSFALILYDPDAPGGDFTHWLIYNIPKTITELKENITADSLKDSLQGAIQGPNGFGSIGYGGPCPPQGAAHRYIFELYSLDTELNLDSNVSKNSFEKTIVGHVLGSGKLAGTFVR